MIMGPQDNIYTVALLPEDGPENLLLNLKLLLKDWMIS